MTLPDVRNPFGSLTDHSVAVTGAARGVGREVCESLRSVGASLLLIDRDGAALDEAVESLRKRDEPGDVVGVVAELGAGDLSGVQGALDGLASLAGWVNNAGAVSHQTAENTDAETFENLFRNNVTSALRGSQIAFGKMTASGAPGGAIVNITSLVVDKVLPDRLSYATSKAALANVTRYCAQEWGPHGIRVNAISPGYIDSRLTRWAADDPRQIAKEQTVSTMALRRLGTATDIAQTVLYLLSPLAGYVTGQTIYVDGGWHLI